MKIYDVRGTQNILYLDKENIVTKGSEKKDKYDRTSTTSLKLVHYLDRGTN